MLVAPVLKKGMTEREVTLPEGRWVYLDGTEYNGGQIVSVPADKSILPFFIKKP